MAPGVRRRLALVCYSKVLSNPSPHGTGRRHYTGSVLGFRQVRKQRGCGAACEAVQIADESFIEYRRVQRQHPLESGILPFARRIWPQVKNPDPALSAHIAAAEFNYLAEAGA